MTATIPPSAGSLEQLRRADRLARAASLWLRREQEPGTTVPPAGPAHRDLLAGLVAGLGARLAIERPVQRLAAYGLALLEYERDEAVDTPARLDAGPGPSADYRAGLAMADRLVAGLGLPGP